MKKVIPFLVLFLCLTACGQKEAAGDAATDDARVQTKHGLVRGLSDGKVHSFKGIPYAAAPVGDLRWRETQPAAKWEGELDATKFGADCAQFGWGGEPGTISASSSEDCLFLNIWKPSHATAESALPVMVWIHGGAFVFGSGSGPEVSGEEFAKKDVILVTFNYRLGRLGHFAFPALSQEHPEEHKGSYAYMDQIMALKWVKNNISAFGGDPDNVTIFGESAGGVSVHSLLTIPLAKGLFHKAIIQSGGGRDGVLTGRPITEENADRYYPVSAETIGVNFARKHNIEGTNAKALAALRALSVAEIVDGGQETDGPGGAPIYSGPILDGSLVMETAESAYKKGNMAAVPIIIGSNSAEVPGGFVNAESKEALFNLFGKFKKEAKKAYDPNGNKELEEILTMVNTDKVWAEPARFTARAYAEKDTPAYIYLFSYVPKVMQERMRYGASHASEIPYVFNNLDARRSIDTVTAKDEKVAKLMNTYWANFAKTGDPNAEGLPKWPVYSPEINNIIEFKNDASAVGIPDPKEVRLDVIEKAVMSKEMQ